MTRRTLTGGLDAKVLDGVAQTLLEVDRRGVAQDLLCRADVRPRVANVAWPWRSEDPFHGLVENAADRLGDVVHARRRAGGDVEDATARAVSMSRPHRRVDDIRDVREVARLLAVAVHGDRIPCGDGGDEERHHRRVLREGALARPEDVEVPESDRLEGLVHATEADAVALRRELRDPVRRDRVGGQRLVHRTLVLRAVDRRRRGEDDAPDSLVARREQHVQGSLDVHRARGQRVLHRSRNRAERTEVIDDLRAAHGVVHALVAAQLAFDDLDVEAFEVRAVPGGEVVEHAHRVAALDQPADDVRPDEACASGDEHFRHQAGHALGRVTATPNPSHMTASSGMPAMMPCAVRSPSETTSQTTPRSAAKPSPGGPRNAVESAGTMPAPNNASSRSSPTIPRSASAWT